MELEPRIGAVIVTGAGSGIGYAITRKLLAEGTMVFAWDIEEGELANIEHTLLVFRKINVARASEVDEGMQIVAGYGKPLAGVVCCAAVFAAKPFLELDEETWDKTFAVNLKGSLFVCQSALPIMLKQGEGSIVLFSSGLARTGSVNGAHYAATKGGILGLARTLALETAADGIRVNVVSPGITDTPQPRRNVSEEQLYSRAASIPLGRIGNPDDMANAAMFLLSSDSSYMTGQDIRVNGGSLMF